MQAVALGIDDSSAYCYVQQQRAEWWYNAYLAHDAAGRAVVAYLMRMGFGGAHSTQCYQGVGTIATRIIRKRQRDFDESHPPPESMQRWVAQRRSLQELGCLPSGPEQSALDYASSFIDDTTMVTTSDIVQCKRQCCESRISSWSVYLSGLYLGIASSSRPDLYKYISLSVSRRCIFVSSSVRLICVSDLLVYLEFRVSSGYSVSRMSCLLRCPCLPRISCPL